MNARSTSRHTKPGNRPSISSTTSTIPTPAPCGWNSAAPQPETAGPSRAPPLGTAIAPPSAG